MQWNSDVKSLLAWTQNPISCILSQCDLAHSPVLHCVISIYQIMSAVAWIVLHHCSISRSLDWIICRLVISLHYEHKISNCCWGKITCWRKVFQNRNCAIKMRREPEDDDIMKANERTRNWDEVLFLWYYLLLWSFIPVRLGSIFWESESRRNMNMKKADSALIWVNFCTWSISDKVKTKQGKVWNLVHSRQRLSRVLKWRHAVQQSL